MFDVGMGEVAVIAVVALLVLGPERLPGAARTAGAVLRKARQSWQNVRTEIERELAAEELKRAMRETAAAADPTADLQNTIHAVKSDLVGDLNRPDSAGSGPAKPEHDGVQPAAPHADVVTGVADERR